MAKRKCGIYLGLTIIVILISCNYIEARKYEKVEKKLVPQVEADLNELRIEYSKEESGLLLKISGRFSYTIKKTDSDTAPYSALVKIERTSYRMEEDGLKFVKDSPLEVKYAYQNEEWIKQ